IVVCWPAERGACAYSLAPQDQHRPDGTRDGALPSTLGHQRGQRPGVRIEPTLHDRVLPLVPPRKANLRTIGLAGRDLPAMPARDPERELARAHHGHVAAGVEGGEAVVRDAAAAGPRPAVAAHVRPE